MMKCFTKSTWYFPLLCMLSEVISFLFCIFNKSNKITTFYFGYFYFFPFFHCSCFFDRNLVTIICYNALFSFSFLAGKMKFKGFILPLFFIFTSEYNFLKWFSQKYFSSWRFFSNNTFRSFFWSIYCLFIFMVFKLRIRHFFMV